MLGWRGRKALDRAGKKLGTLEEIYLDAESSRPQWGAVKTGLFGGKLTFVPLEGARAQDDDVVLDWPEHVVKDAPRIDADGELSPEEEDRLYDHYERYDSPEYHSGGVGGGGDAMTGERGGADAERHGEPTRERAQGQGAGIPTGDDTGARTSATTSSTPSARGRRPRIRRFIEEELGPDGNPIRRETRTEEVFE